MRETPSGVDHAAADQTSRHTYTNLIGCTENDGMRNVARSDPA
jgi:hypothetical protein